MARLTFIASLLTALLLLVTFTTANPVALPKKAEAKDASSFHFKPTDDDGVSCPASNRKMWEGAKGTKFGILCGWDTKSSTYKWGPLHRLTFEQCMKACSHIHDCTVATYNGNCYLKKNANGKGYIKSGKKKIMTAIKLNRGQEVKKDD